MKKTSLLLLFIWVLLNQTAANAYSQGITLSFKSAPLSTVFKEIEKQTNYDFIYPADELYARKVSISVTNAKVEEVMDLCLQGLPFTYSVNEKRIVVKKVEEKATISGEKTEPIELTGKVVDANGKPVEGATITVRGTGVTTFTNADGTFVIKGVDSKASIMVTFVGFEPQIVPVKGKTDLSIKLVVTAQQMKEVVISTGYQKVSNERFVGSYSQLDSAAYHRRAGMNIIDRLDGTVVGVLFNKKNSSGIEIQIRGISTINSSTSPLIVVDNFPYPYDLNTINPNDVDNVVVLKDAAATSIWGSRAGNGVIVITTKKGKYNQPIKVTANSNLTISGKPRLFSYPSISSQDFIEVEKYLFNNSYYSAVLNNPSFPVVSPVVEILDKMEKGIIGNEEGTDVISKMGEHDYRNDLLKYVYQRKKTQQHNISLSGGGSFLSYLFSLGYNKEGTGIKNSKGNDQFTINASTSMRPMKSLEITTGVALTQTYSQHALFPSFKSYPYAKIADNNGKALPIGKGVRLGYVDTVGGGQLLDWRFRPLDEINFIQPKSTLRFVNISMGVNYKISDWVNVGFNGQYIVSNNDLKTLYPTSSYYTRDLINSFTDLNFTDPVSRYPVPLGAIVDYSSNKSAGFNLRGQININKSWTNHAISSLIAIDLSETNASGNSNRLYGYNEQVGSFKSGVNFDYPYPIFRQGTVGRISSGQSFFENTITRFVSLTSNVSYTFNDRYNVYASARRDGANIFGVSSNRKWKPLWSVGTSWNISKESFFRISWISNLRLRASYGISGNVNNTFPGNTTINYLSDLAQYTNFTYAIVGTPPNPNLRWEEVKFSNLGLDLSFLKNKLDVNIEVYNKRSKDLIGAVPLPYSSGVSSYFVNSASLKGNGLDLSLTGKISAGQIFWNPRLGLSYAKVIVTKVFIPYLYKASDFINFSINPAVGQLAYSISSYKWAGLDPDNGDPRGYYNGKISKEYQKIFNDTAGNQKLHGSAIPLYSGYIANTLSWKGLSLSFNLLYKLNYYYRKPALNYENLFSGWNGVNEYTQRWQKRGDENITSVPSMIFPIPNGMEGRSEFYQFSEINILRGDHIKFQDLQIQYAFKRKEIGFASKLTLYFYMNNLNLILWRKDKSKFDPEYVGGGDYIPPPPTSVAFGINLEL